MHVVIAGGGIGGLTAALSLHAAGIGCTVLEAARTVQPVGAGINLQPHAVRELTELGLGDELAAVAVPTAEMVYVDGRGARILKQDCGRARGYRWPQYSVHRGELQTVLLAAVRERLGPRAVRAGARVTGWTQEAAGVRVRLTDRSDGGAAEVAGDALVGSDGVHSAVRALLHPDEGPMRWSGTVMWRGVTEAPPFLTGRTMVHASDGRGTRLVAYPLAVATGRATVPVNWVCQAQVAAARPLGPGEEADWNRSGRLTDVLPRVDRWDLGFLDTSALVTDCARILEYPMVDRDPLPSWGTGRVTLLGDAAHPMYPVGANGGSQAVVDARVLARELATAGPVPDALARYAGQRRPATAAVVRANREMDRAERAVDVTGLEDVSEAEAARGREQYRELTAAYRHSTGSDVEALNTRPSLDPPRAARP